MSTISRESLCRIIWRICPSHCFCCELCSGLPAICIRRPTILTRGVRSIAVLDTFILSHTRLHLVLHFGQHFHGMVNIGSFVERPRPYSFGRLWRYSVNSRPSPSTVMQASPLLGLISPCNLCFFMLPF